MDCPLTAEDRSVHWADIVQRIASGDMAAEEALCKEFQRGVTIFVSRTLQGGAQVEEIVNDVLMAAIRNIRRGYVLEGRALPGYIRVIAQRRISEEISEIQRRRNEQSVDATMPISDHRPTPEQEQLQRERQEIAVQTLALLPAKQREVLRRFYLDEQSPEQICAQMSLTPVQFRLLKSRARERFSQMGRRVMATARLRSALGHGRCGAA